MMLQLWLESSVNLYISKTGTNQNVWIPKLESSVNLYISKTSIAYIFSFPRLESSVNLYISKTKSQLMITE